MKKTALITGASGGIGLETAKIFASEGNNLILVARSKDTLERIRIEIEKQYKVEVLIIVKDLTVAGSSREIYEEVLKNGISVNYLVNNAGYGDIGFFAGSDWNKQEGMINLNITALTYLTRLFLPGMISAGEGRILNVASTAAFQPGPTMSVYFATKAYVLHFSEAINNELRDSGITVTVLCPGSTESNFHAVAIGDVNLVKKRKRASAYKVALAGYRGMMKGKPVVIPGFLNTVMAFAVRFLPREFIVGMVRKVQTGKNLNT